MEKSSYKMCYLDELYENITPLGKTDEKEVFLAKNKQSGKIVVKKYVDREAIEVYERIKDVQNRHLEQLYDCACSENRGIVITEYISGETLTEYMEKHGLFKEQETVDLVCDLLDGIQKIHALNVIHRDINPDNIMISADGVPKLIDFGIARQKKQEQSRDTRVLGTVGYAAPEQFGFLQTDERADIYALGVLLNKMLTGFFPGEKMYERQPLKKVIQKCTAMDAEQRFENVKELRENLIKSGYREKFFGERALKMKNVKKQDGMKISWLPGFRTGYVWKNVTATIWYFCLLIYTTSVVLECAETWQTFLLEAVSIFMYGWAANLLLVNVGNWTDRVWPFSKCSKPVLWVIRIFIWLILFYNGVLLDNYVRYDMLGMVRTQ